MDHTKSKQLNHQLICHLLQPINISSVLWGHKTLDFIMTHLAIRSRTSRIFILETNHFPTNKLRAIEMQNLGGGASRTQRETKLRFRFQLAFFQKGMSLFGVPLFAQNMLTTHCQWVHFNCLERAMWENTLNWFITNIRTILAFVAGQEVCTSVVFACKG